MFGPNKTTSLEERCYAFAIVNDYYIFTWILFLASKNEAITEFSKLCKKLQNEKESPYKKIRSDHGGEFENMNFKTYRP